MTQTTDPFRWICLAVAVIAVGFFGWAVNDLRLEIKETSRKLNEDLPRILANTKKSSETLAKLAEDVKNVRNLAVGSGKSKDNSIIIYADDLLSLIEKQDAVIAVEKVIGKKLKDPKPAKDWVVGKRREALFLSFRVRSKREMVEQLCKTLTRRKWLIKFKDEKPKPLLEWLKANHEPTAALFMERKPKAKKP